MLALLGSALFSVGYGMTFPTQELASPSASGYSVTIDVGATTTTVDVEAPLDAWLGIGFGALAMADGANVVIYTGSETLEDRLVSGYGGGSSLGNFWTVTNYVTSDSQVTYTMTRDNDISGSCTDCYVFSADDTEFNILLAMGNEISFPGADGHVFYSGYSLTAAVDTPAPVTPAPNTPAPVTPAPVTPAPVDDTDFNMVYGPQELDSPSASGYSVTIKVGATATSVDVEAPLDAWLGIGFDALRMADGANVVIYTGSETLEDRYVSGYSGGTSLGNYWTVTDYVTTESQVTYTMTRDNDISDTCDQCYVFSADDTDIDILLSMGDVIDFPGNGHVFYSGYSLGDADTPAPTMADADTPAPTMADDSDDDDIVCPTGGLYVPLPEDGSETAPYLALGLCLPFSASGLTGSQRMECDDSDVVMDNIYFNDDCSGNAISSSPFNNTDGLVAKCNQEVPCDYAQISIDCGSDSYDVALFMGDCSNNGTASFLQTCTDSSATRYLYSSLDCSGDAVREEDILADFADEDGCTGSVVACYLDEDGGNGGSSAGFKMQVGLVMAAALSNFLFM